VNDEEKKALLARVSRVLEIPGKAEDIKFACNHAVARDLMTGFPRPETLMLAIEDEIRRAIRYKHHPTFTVVYVDADDLKEVNDAHGHGAGDQLIKSLALRLQNGVRSTDLISRSYEFGDEFMILMPETSYHRARRAMRRIQGLGEDQGLRFSFGIMEHKEAVDGASMVKLADQRMRRQKKRRKRAEG